HQAVRTNGNGSSHRAPHVRPLGDREKTSRGGPHPPTQDAAFSLSGLAPRRAALPCSTGIDAFIERLRFVSRRSVESQAQRSIRQKRRNLTSRTREPRRAAPDWEQRQDRSRDRLPQNLPSVGQVHDVGLKPLPPSPARLQLRAYARAWIWSS